MAFHRSVIIVAGGSGQRMGAAIPKQFLLLEGKAILHHTLAKFHAFDPTMQLIVVLPESHQTYWKDYCTEHKVAIAHKVVTGGSERFYSVSNGLQVAAGKVIGIHDGVRPLVSTETIQRCFDGATKNGNAIPTLPVTESLRMVTSGGSQHIDRAAYRSVQTPQCFEAKSLKKAYEQPFSAAFTDDASVVEAAGNQIHLVAGNHENIKITSPSDLITATALIGAG